MEKVILIHEGHDEIVESLNHALRSQQIVGRQIVIDDPKDDVGLRMKDAWYNHVIGTPIPETTLTVTSLEDKYFHFHRYDLGNTWILPWKNKLFVKRLLKRNACQKKYSKKVI